MELILLSLVLIQFILISNLRWQNDQIKARLGRLEEINDKNVK